MTSFTNSLSLICPAAFAGDVDKLLEALGRGPGNLSLSFSPSGEAPATHSGCHTYDDELASIIASRIVPETANLEGVELDAGDAAAAIGCISLYAVPDTEALANITSLATSLGLIRF